MATVRSKEQLLEEEKRLKDAIEKKHGKSVEQLYNEREKRIRDAIELRQPDRVPFVMARASSTHFAAVYGGVTLATAYYDPVAWKEAYKKVVLDFEPDAYVPAMGGQSGAVLELLDAKQTKWPGGALPPNVTNQFVEGEYMKADEYDWFLSDPSDFAMRAYLPRVYGILEPLTKLPPFRTQIGGQGFTAMLGLFLRPEFQQLAKTLQQAALKQDEARKLVAGSEDELVRLGFPPSTHGGGVGGAPFDAISDFLRGMRGSMIDLYRRPEKIMAACEMIQGWTIARATPADPTKRGNPKITGSALHRGSDGFMSIPQFEKFYWPGLKKAAQMSIDLGYVYSPFCEGVWDQRLQYWRELPKGKLLLTFEKTNLERAKDIFGDHSCLMGGLPSTLMELGTTQEVEEHVKKMIKVVGKGGGFILSNSSAMDHAKPANVKAAAETVKKHGWY